MILMLLTSSTTPVTFNRQLAARTLLDHDKIGELTLLFLNVNVTINSVISGSKDGFSQLRFNTPAGLVLQR